MPESKVIPNDLLEAMIGTSIEAEKVGNVYKIDLRNHEERLRRVNSKFYEDWIEIKKNNGDDICKIIIPANNCLPL